ncbi:MAG TPA: VWA domain-containing protein [Vicinamibacterales bacterium]|nr:VWA domain-containing protein [Vicinamibacterales bacterium]
MRLSLLAPLAALCSLTTLAAQQTTFRGGTQTVAIYATVVDSTGRLVPDLERQHFEVYDDLKLQELTLFKSDVQPVTVVVMLDTSGSMTANLELLKLAAEQFVIRLLPDDKARIGSFSDKIIISPTFTSNRDDLVRIIHEDIQYGNPTFLWDAIDESMTALANEQGRRVVLVFTDGDDETSKHATLQSVISRAQTEEFMVYAIGLRSQILGHTTRPAPGLRKLAEETGGGYFELLKTADLGPTFTRVADELHRQYVLGFTPQSLDGRMHKLDVRVKLPGMSVRARKSYLASKPTG